MKTVMSNLNQEPALVITDGAAIGSEMNELYQLMHHKPGAVFYSTAGGIHTGSVSQIQ